jgi:hypothetical protein
LSKPCKQLENNVRPKTYTLSIALPVTGYQRAIGYFSKDDLAELDVCLLSCVSLLCGLQSSPQRPHFILYGLNDTGHITWLAGLVDHTTGWVGAADKPFTVEAL